MATQDPNAPNATSVPTVGGGGGQNSAFQTGQDAFNTGYNALGQQAKLAGNTADVWSGIQQANQAQTAQGLAALKRQAATNLYANKGSLGGGGGLAAAQGANAQSAFNAANFNTQANTNRAQVAQQANQAGIDAQGQIATSAGNQYKMLQDQQQRQTRINAALDSARAISKRLSGTIFTTGADKNKMIAAINQEVLGTETDPEVIAAVQNYTAGLQNGSTDVPGSINI